MPNHKRILITPGEPAGIGPDITLQIAMQPWEAELIAIADLNLLQERARLLGLPLKISEWKGPDQPVTTHQAGTLKVRPVKLAHAVVPQKLDAANASYVQQTLDLATDLCLEKKAQAIVTGPVHKGIMQTAGLPFLGHTEYFAKRCAAATHTPCEPVMLFVTESLKVALVTTHLPLAAVPKALTSTHIQSVLSILYSELKQKFGIASPRILVCGLNPHAGEGGYLGLEEIEIITPALQAFQKQHGPCVIGPLPADTIFTPHYLMQADAVLAMYHDQALPVVKYIGFGQAVNVTLGLPLIRTSVDHGTALNITGTGKADAGSMAAALKLAIQLAH